MKAGFAHVDITPPIGAHKVGWIKTIVIERIMDPLFARIAVFANGTDRVALIQLDTLSIRWTQVDDMRRRIEAAYGFPGANVLVAATHNHCGPAVAGLGEVSRDDSYIASMVERVVAGFGQAVANVQEAQVGFGSVREYRLSHNRRVVLRSGIVLTHGDGVGHPDALFVEGPIDPQVTVIAARRPDGVPLGAVVNFTCHPTHHGGGPAVTAGYPGVVVRALQAKGHPDAVFLNGACGNISSGNPYVGYNPPMEELGEALAEDAQRAIEAMSFASDLPLGAASVTLQLPYRDYTAADVKGTAHGAQRFIDPGIYDRAMPRVIQRIRERGTQPAELQVLRIGGAAIVSVPAEYFVQFGLRIKEQTYPWHTMVAAHANGMIGYVPTREAFDRGGYETTFGEGWRMAPEAGDLMAEAAVKLVNATPPPDAPVGSAAS